ncbi:hypothetical protein [Streptomyces capitiformicae]|uniref:Uncharacterized protein n=1 Tax=Streptomyces capitiformicae TaxID=2014920 RepID=A0A919L1T3_9ACTN|nr:hypothetical protein [Streptomyces capitiformicae]GHH80772.1 hypothetical protein GCM10017771_00950 [Streptomyces capitiformicae]
MATVLPHQSPSTRRGSPVRCPLEALVGFALLTATVSWVLGILPALARRPAPALRAREGLAHVLGDPVLRPGLGCATTPDCFTFVSSSGLVVLCADRVLELTRPPSGWRWASGRVAPSSGRWRRPGCPGASAWGGASPRVNLNSLQTAVVPEGLRSRVAGAYSTVNYGVRPLGAVVGGTLATAIGLRATLVTAAVGGTLSPLWLLPSPRSGERRGGRTGTVVRVPADLAPPHTTLGTRKPVESPIPARGVADFRHGTGQLLVTSTR